MININVTNFKKYVQAAAVIFKKLPTVAKIAVLAVLAISIVGAAIAGNSDDSASKTIVSRENMTRKVSTADDEQSDNNREEEKEVLGASSNAQSPTPAGATPKPSTTPPATAAKPATPTPAPTPKPAPAPTPAPQCPECGGDPDKAVAHTGSLILSPSTITIVAGSANNNLITIRSDSGENVTNAFVLYGAGTPMITAISAEQFGTYSSQRTLGFVTSPGFAPGTYTLKIAASGVNQGMYYGYVTVIVTAS